MTKPKSISVQVELRRTVSVEIEIDDVIESINELDMIRRWHYLAKLLNEIDLSSENLSRAQTNIVTKYLKRQLDTFSKSNANN